jgi:rhodanese-related sulfurtransferase
MASALRQAGPSVPPKAPLMREEINLKKASRMIIVCLLSVGMSACVSQKSQKEELEKISQTGQITATQLLERLEQEPDLYVLDVRQPEELSGSLGQLAQAKNIPLGEIVARKNEIPKEQDVVVICHRGKRSQTAIAHLKPFGYVKLMNAIGGMRAIRKVKPLEKLRIGE